MTVDPMPLRAVPGGRKSRQDRREAEMRTLWGEAWELAEAGNDNDALDTFLEANDLGMGFPTDESRICTLTGVVALGRARRPFTDWDADVAVSHGRDERRPTALDRLVGWEDGNGEEHDPERLIGGPMVKAGVVVGLSRKGLEPLFAHLLARPEDQVEVKVTRRGVFEIHPVETKPGGGPTAVED